MSARFIGLVAWLSSAAALHPVAVSGRHVHTVLPAHRSCHITSCEEPTLAGTVAEQASQIAELRRKVDELQRERDDAQQAPQKKRPRRRPRTSTGEKIPIYKLWGALPQGYNAVRVTNIEHLIARRVNARLKRHYSEADRIQKRLLRMGVKLDDRRRTWSLPPGWEAKQASLDEEDESSWRQQQQLQLELERRINDLFAYWDEDGNGLIDRKEFSLAMQILAISGSASDYDRIFDEWDVDKSGELDFGEIKEALIALEKQQGDVFKNLADAHETVKLLS